MTEGIEEIGAILPVARSEKERTESTRRGNPAERDNPPTAPSPYPHKGSLADIVV